MGIILLTLSLGNLEKCRFDYKISTDRNNRIELARGDKLLEEFASDPNA
jgi:hypothetical protein